MTEAQAAERRKKSAERSRLHYAANRDKKIEYAKDYRDSNRDKVAASQRTTLYGITPERFEELLSSQNNSCAICGSKEPGGGRTRFSVDHCHTTQKVRALLCGPCNLGLGHFHDNPERLIKAASYIKQHQQEAA